MAVTATRKRNDPGNCERLRSLRAVRFWGTMVQWKLHSFVNRDALQRIQPGRDLVRWELLYDSYVFDIGNLSVRLDIHLNDGIQEALTIDWKKSITTSIG